MNNIVSVERKPNPVKNANFLSKLWFLYMFPIFKRTLKKEMTEDDICEPLLEHKSSELGDQLEKLWKDEYSIRNHKSTALHRALFTLFGLRFITLGLIKGVQECFMIVCLPISIGKVVSYFQTGDNATSREEAIMYSFFISMAFLLETLVTHPIFINLSHLAVKMRVACSTLVYRKALRLNRSSLAKTTVGQIINLLSNDVNKFSEAFLLSIYLWITPIQISIGTYLIYREIQISAFFGVAFLLAFIPLQIWVAKMTSTLRLKTALRTDERVRLMSEIINGIQVIKMYCWEKSFAKLIKFARRKEMNAIRLHQYLSGVIYALAMFNTRTSIFISILSFVLLGNLVSADKVFTITGIYNIVKPLITTLFSISISSLAEINVSLGRLNKFLSYDEFSKGTSKDLANSVKKNTNVENYIVNDIEKLSKINGAGDLQEPEIILENVDAVWLADSSETDLKKLSLNIRGNQFIAIIGTVGSGKSSLIHLFLKELTILKGNMKITGKVCYAAQEPWLFSGSIRQNILFGEEYDKDRYEMIISVCALKDDIEQFPYGDNTLVGERGRILSGGQKARINLARCIYKEADIYLLDDPLSAVDVNVGKHLYFECINKFLNGKVRILVTHQLQYLHTTDKILIMENGTIQQSGTYEDLQTTGLDFARLLQQSGELKETNERKGRSMQQSEVNSKNDNNTEQLQDEEEMKHGSISFATYYEYARSSGGTIFIILLILIFVSGYFIAFGGDYFVAYWVNLEQDFTISNHSNNTEIQFSRPSIIYFYSAITLGTIIFALGQTTYFMAFCTEASTNLHNATFDKLITATMQFFNLNTSGRILNRFSQDMGIIDDYIPHVLFEVITIALQFISIIVLASIVEPLIFPSSIILMALFIGMRNIYVKTSRNLKRIMAITHSPMFSHITASLHGITTIRAYDAEQILIDEFDYFQDRHTSSNFLFLASSQCFGFWGSFICVCFMTFAVFTIIIFNENRHGGDMGLVVTEFIGLVISLSWGMRQWSELENQMTSTERIIEYKNVQSEPDRPKIANIPRGWPTEVQLEFRNVNLRYGENSPYVLKNICFCVEPKQKIGIVGRTGAGKSSIITSLFQLYPIEGSIFIDAIDITKMPLEDVRNKISIIPQEPVLFSGTMRRNLDPLEEYCDEVIWRALDEVELKHTINEMEQGLNSTVSDGGSNFSVGERQLICLARALIRNNKILVLDEATANVDPFTDSLIQKTIKIKFADCTVLTVAHRLNTVMDSDKILVMMSGQVQEFDHPYLLLQNSESILYDLVNASGEVTSKQLEAVAKQNFDSKLKNDR